jgi:hypothetical protein
MGTIASRFRSFERKPRGSCGIDPVLHPYWDMLVARGLGPVDLPLDRSVIAPVAKVAAERDLAELHLLAQGKKLITSHQHTPANHALVLFRCLSGIGGFRIVALVWRHADNGAVAAHGLDHVRIVLAVRRRLWVARAFAISVSFKISGKFDNAVAICGIKPEFSAFVGIGGQRSWSRWIASAKYEVRPMRDRSIPAHNEKLALEKLFGFCPDFHDLSFVKLDCRISFHPRDAMLGLATAVNVAIARVDAEM